MGRIMLLPDAATIERQINDIRHALDHLSQQASWSGGVLAFARRDSTHPLLYLHLQDGNEPSCRKVLGMVGVGGHDKPYWGQLYDHHILPPVTIKFEATKLADLVGRIEAFVAPILHGDRLMEETDPDVEVIGIS